MRAAIQEGNALPGTDTINLPTGKFTLTIPGRGEDAAATGDLDITDDLTINGTGTTSPRTVINGNRLDRVFDMHGTANVTISHVAIVNGAADTNGGGIRNQSTGTLTLSSAAIRGNHAGNVVGGNGGGIFTGGGTAMLTDVTITANCAGNGGGDGSGYFGGNGGGIENGWLDVGDVAATLTLSNVIITSNRAGNSDRYGADIGGNGGGIANNRVATLTNVTVSGNRAGSCRGSGCARGVGGGIAYGATLVNTIVANNVPDNCGSGGGFSNGHNLDSGTSCGFDLSNANPMLGPLRNNGGFAPTQTLKAGSPAIGAGDPTQCPSTDARGLPRLTDGKCDIGAYEVQP